MSNLPGETPQHSLSPKQMEALETFVNLHLAVSNADIRSVQYYDLTSANLRDWPTLAQNLDLHNVNTYYSAMAGIVVGTECVKGLVEVNDVPLGNATVLLMRSLGDIASDEEELDELSAYVKGLFEKLEVNLNEPEQQAAAFFAAGVGAEWAEGIAGIGSLSMTTAAEITRVSFARLCPIQFDNE